MNSEHVWTAAIWNEGDDKKNEFGTIPTKWIKGNIVYWPRKMSAPKSVAEMKDPTDEWKKFTLVKVKHSSGE